MMNNFRQQTRLIFRIVMGLIIAQLLLVTTVPGRDFTFMPKYWYPENGLGGITGEITGDLKPLQHVMVFLMQHDKIVDQTETDDDGFYKFRYLEEGNYDLKAVKDGFITCMVTSIPVAPDKVTKLDFYQPLINNNHMPVSPIVESYHYYYHLMKHPYVSYPR